MLDGVAGKSLPRKGQRFGRAGQLEVIGALPERDSKGSIFYEVVCHVCSKDTEMFPENFRCTKQIIQQGCEPCGCSQKMRWTQRQQMLRVTRLCDKNSASVEQDSEWNGLQTKLRLTCLKCGTPWKRASVWSVLHSRGTCRKCNNSKVNPKKAKEDAVMIESFLVTENYSPNYKFWRSDELNRHGHRSYWNYTCPVCSADEYVKEGLCSGVFRSTSSILRRGDYSCRCSKKFQWTQAQREYQIGKVPSVAQGTYKFVGWDAPYKDSLSKFLMECPEHGVWNTTFKSFINNTGCPDCAVSGFKLDQPASIYVLRAVNLDGREFTGYGISNDASRRLVTHKSKLLKAGFGIVDREIFYVDTGKVAREIEKLLLLNFLVYPQEVEGFRTESTFYYNYDDMLEFIDNVLNKDN